MIKWETIVSTADEKITLLQWLKMVEKAINDGALTGISVQQADAEHATITFNFEGDPAQAFTITLPAGPPGAQGEPGTDGAAGADGTDGRDALVQNRALSSANITSPMAIPIDALNRTAVLGEPIVMFATDTTENKTYMLIGTVTNVGVPDVNPYTFVSYSSKVDITGMTGATGPAGTPGTDLFEDFTSLKIDTTDATVSYVSPAAHITGARLIGYKSSGNEEVECAVDIPIKAGDNVTIDASEDGKSIEVSATGGGSSDIISIHNITLSYTFSNKVCFSIAVKNNANKFDFNSVIGSLSAAGYATTEDARKGATGVWNNKTVYSIQSNRFNSSITLYYTDGTSEEITESTLAGVTDIIEPI